MLGLGVSRVAGLIRRGAEATRTALAWWAGELGGLVPARVRDLLGGDAGHLLVHIRADGIYLDEQAAGAMPLSAEGGVPLPPALRARSGGDTGCVLLLPAATVLRCTVELPLAAAAEFTAAIPFLVERHTPFTLDQVRHAARLLARDRGRKIVRIEMAVVPRAALDGPLAMFAAHGLPVAAVRVEGDHGTPPLDFVDRDARGAGRHLSWRREPWKPVLAAALALLVAGPPLVAARVHARAQALAAEVTATAAAGRRGAALQAEVKAQAAAAAFLPGRLRGLLAVEVLAALTRLLPDDTWLFSLELEPGEARLAGFSADVPVILGRLQASPAFDAPELRAPVVHGVDGHDRFEIALHIRRPAP